MAARVPTLAGHRLKSDDDGVDGRTVRFLLKQSLAVRKKDEEVAFGGDASGCRCILRLAWSVLGYTLMRQFTRLLVWWYFYGPLYLAVDCSTLSVPEEDNTWIILGDDFGMDAVFSSFFRSTVDTYSCQFTEACGISRIA